MATQTYPVPPPDQTQIVNVSGAPINPATEETLQTLLGQSARSIKDDNNTSATPLGVSGNFTGTFTDIRDHGVVTIFFLSDQPPAFTNGVDDTDGYEAYVEWSHDGITLNNPATDLLARSQLNVKTIDGGVLGQLYVAVNYLNQPHVDHYYRVYVDNNPTTAQSPVLSRIDSWLSKEAFTGTYSALDADLTDLSVALLARAVIAGDVVDGLGLPTGDFENVRLSPSGALNIAQPNVEIFRYATPDDPDIPTGPPVTIHPILNTEANVVDTGWFPSTLYPGGSRVLLRTEFGGGTVKAFIANASDDQGSNAEGLLFSLSDTALGSPQVNGADFFDRYARIILVNDSGTDTNGITARITGAQVPQPGVTSSISSQLFDFFPATLNKSALFGKIPNSPLLKALEITTNGFLNTSSEEFLREVSLGRVAGHSIEEIQGQSEAVGTLFEDVWFVGGVEVDPVTADTLSLSSTSALDTLLGTGVRKVIVRGLDANYDPIEEEVSLNGITAATTSNQYLRVFEVVASDVGSLEVSAGIITTIHNDTGLPTARLKTGILRSAKSQYTVPAGKVAILVEEEVNSGIGDNADFRLQSRPFGGTAFTTSRLQSVSGSAVSRNVTATENVFPPKSDLRWQAKKIGIGTTRATVNYSLMLIDEVLV